MENKVDISGYSFTKLIKEAKIIFPRMDEINAVKSYHSFTLQRHQQAFCIGTKISTLNQLAIARTYLEMMFFTRDFYPAGETETILKHFSKPIIPRIPNGKDLN